MSKHPGCVTDPLVKQWWREYRRLGRVGCSFAEYVAQRAFAEAVTAPPGPVPSYVAGCGHAHAWGASCSSLTI